MQSVKAVVLIGVDRDELRSVFSAIDTVFADSMMEAVRAAANKAGEGDLVLLSPACASMDMFENFEARGQAFSDAARAIASEVAHHG
jgi:UDP-N-acetylmuramoylalanine--D-glutamate ligase